MPPGCRRAWVTEAHLCSRQPLPARGRGQRPALRSPSLPGTRVLQAYARSAEEVRQLLGDRGGRRAGGGVRREERGEGRGARGGWPWVREDLFLAEQTHWPWAAAGCRGRRPGCRERAEHRLLTARTRDTEAHRASRPYRGKAFPGPLMRGAAGNHETGVSEDVPRPFAAGQQTERRGWGLGLRTVRACRQTRPGASGPPGAPPAVPEACPPPRRVLAECPLHVPRANERALGGCPKACGPLQGQCGGCPRRHTLELDPAVSREKELEGGGERSRGAIVTARNGRRRGWPGTQLEWPAVTSGTTHTPQNARRGGATICPAGDPP